jgi:tRNA/rRNA methyltransferase
MKNFSVRVVLVRTIYDSNIGASSRAMANMGIEQLILIGPQTEVTYAAQQAAASGQAGLQNRKTYEDWDEFFAHEPDDGVRISLTARDGRGRQVRDLKEALTWICAEDPRFQEGTTENSADTVPVYLIFGPEDWGLSADDLKFTHFSCSIPTYGDNTSLNLAQAVLLALFILRDTWGGRKAALEGQQPDRKTLEKPQVFPEESLRTWLTEMGFDISDDRKVNAYLTLKRMLLHNVPTPKELIMLDTVLQQGIRKLREYNQLREQAGLPAIKPKK